MKITCSKRDDLMRARYDYDTLTNQYKKKVDEGENKARFATDEVAAHIEDEIRSQIGSTSLAIDIDVRTDWDFINGEEHTGWKVTIQAHEHDKHTNDNAALAWNWSAKLGPEGDVKKESGSWSGLQAITPEQIDDLEESVRILRELNNMDWSVILNKAIPRYSDYIDKEAQSRLHDLKQNRPDFDRQILEADIEDAIESGAWIKLKGRPETDYYRGARVGDYWCKIDSMTPRFVKCHIAYGEDLTHETDERIGKDKLFSYIVKPIQTRS